jgi:streptogramin lyase
VDVGERPEYVAVAAGSVWVTLHATGAVQRVDVDAKTADHPIEVGAEPEAITSDGLSVWVANTGEGSIARVDAATGAVRTSQRYDRRFRGITVDHGDLWAVDEDGGELVRFDARSLDVEDVIAVDGAPQPTSIAASATALWITDAGGDFVVRYDKRSRAFASIPLPGEAERSAAFGDTVWVALKGTRIARIDAADPPPTTTRVIDVGVEPGQLAADSTGVWITSTRPARVVHVDAGSGSVDGEVRVDGRAFGVAVVGDVAWVARSRSDAVTEVAYEH